MNRRKVFFLLMVPVFMFSLLFAGCGTHNTMENTQGINENSINNEVFTPFGYLVLTHNVQGNDIECIGRPEGYYRVEYKNTKETGYEETEIVYAAKGDDYENIKRWINNRLEECGYKKESENNGAQNTFGFEGKYYSIEGIKKSENTKEDINIEGITMKLQNGETYTFVHITLYREKYMNQNENTEEMQNQENNGNEIVFNEYNEINIINEKVEEENNKIKPLLKSIFGDAKIIEGNEYNYGNQIDTIFLKYVVLYPICGERMKEFINKLQDEGWMVQYSHTSENGAYEISLTKNNVEDGGTDMMNIVCQDENYFFEITISKSFYS